MTGENPMLSSTAQPHRRPQRTRQLLLAIAIAAAASCSDSTAPDLRAVAGTYEATHLMTMEGAMLNDHLAAGASLDIVLNANGTTSGRFVLPGEIDADLAGTWTLNDGMVEFNQSADTFIRDMTFEVAGNALVGDETFFSGGTPVRVQVTLTRQ